MTSNGSPRRWSSQWSSVAQRAGHDTFVVVGERHAGLVGRVRQPSAINSGVHASELLAELVHGVDTADTPGTVDAVIEAVTSVHAACRRGEGVWGAATLTLLLLESSAVSVVHVGDASAFRLRGGIAAELTPLTNEHTLAAELSAAGRIPNARARAALTRLIGGDEPLVVDLTRVPLEVGRSLYAIVGCATVDFGDLVRGAASPTGPAQVLDQITSVVDECAVVVVETDPSGCSLVAARAVEPLEQAEVDA